MGSKPLVEVGGDTYVTLIWNCKALDEIDVLLKPSPFARVQRGASGDSLRESLRPAGGWHPQPAVFYPTIREPLRATKGGCRGAI